MKNVITRDGAVTGVALADGTEFSAPIVISNADPVRSLVGFLDEGVLDPEFRKRVSEIDLRGSMARIHLLIDELPNYIGLPPGKGPQHLGHQMLGASVANFEKAYVAEQQGVIADDYVIEAVIQSVTDPTLAPKGLHTMTLGVQQLPGELSAEDPVRNAAKDAWAQQVVDRLCDYAPNLKDHILNRYTITPKDLEDEWGMTGGNIFHAAMFDKRDVRRPPAARALALPDPRAWLLPVRVRDTPRRWRHGRPRTRRGPHGACRPGP